MRHSWQLCEAGLTKAIHPAHLTIMIPSELRWPDSKGVTGQLLGGAMQTLRNRQKNTTSDDDAAKDRIPPIHPEEDLYQRHVLRALACDESKDDWDIPRDVLSETDFSLLSTE